VLSNNQSIMSSPASFYIPSVYANITQEMMKKTFARMNIGVLSHVDFVEQQRRDGKPAHKKAYVYFEHLYEASRILDNVTREGSTRVYYANTPHVYWVLLENTRKPTPSSKSLIVLEDGEINEEATNNDEPVQYTEEEDAFVPVEDFSLVDANYASVLEGQIAQMRYEIMQLQTNAQTMFARYNQALANNRHLQDIQDKWRTLIVNNQMDRLRNIVLRGENIRACPGSEFQGCGMKLDFDHEMCDDCLLARKHENAEMSKY